MPDYMFDVNRETIPHTIPGTGISVLAPGLRGRVTFQRKHAGGPEQRATAISLRDAAMRGTADPLDQALGEIGTLQVNDIETDAPTPEVRRPEGVRAGVGALQDDEVQIDYVPKPDEYSFVIYQSEDGAVSFHFATQPAAAPPALSAPEERTRSIGRVDRYRIQLRKPSPPPAERAETRFGLITLGKKLLKLVVGKIMQHVVGAAEYGAVWIWESTARSCQGFHGGADSKALLADQPLTFSDWDSLAGSGKKGLLFIHGTTSTTSGAFGALNCFPEVGQSLYAKYEKRVIGFNHHTLTKSVVENVADFYAALPGSGGPFSFDIICHSRGGLIARVLKELSPSQISVLLGKAWQPSANVKIGKIVFVATPNVGTELADPDDIPHALDLLANVASLFPGAGLSLAGVLSCAAYVAETAFKSLPGLRDMCPGSSLLKMLNQADPSVAGPPLNDYYAVESNFSAQGLLNSVLTAALKYLFQGNLNDLIVPTLGVSDIDGSNLGSSAVLYFGSPPATDDVPHTGYFKRAETWKSIQTALS